jgi:Spy/CpxP family protein refolding chaperone
MHGLVSWWHGQRAGMSHGCGSAAHFGGQHGGHHGGHGDWPGGEGGGDFGDGGDGGGGFGVRRPLRFLAYKLGLDERQVTELARVLNELKTERAQAEVDRRRTVASLADAVAGEAFDSGKASEGGNLRVQSAERLRDAVIKALQQIHALLDPEQRQRLAYLIRTGTLAI